MEQILLQCYHCGNKGLHNVVATHEQDFGGYIVDEYKQIVSRDLDEQIVWKLLSCPVCNMVTLYELYSNEAYVDRDGERMYDKEIIYPSNKLTYEGVPDSVKSTFESALKVKGISTEICLTSLRITLEAICKDKKASGNDLNSMVKDLVDKNILPLTFDDACWVIRRLGNSAAHANHTTIYVHEVNEVIELLESIIKYLYCLPVKIKDLKKKVEEINVKG